MNACYLYTIAAIAVLAMGGCVTHRDIAVRVTDLGSGEPIASARVTVEHAAVFAQIGAQDVQLFQEGFTDEFGQWRGRGADGLGFVMVSAVGYGEVLIGFGLDWRWPTDLQISLKRSEAAKEVPASAVR